MMGGVDLTPSPPDQRVCSARGCRQTGVWELRWNNPRLHPPDRRKSWLACADHREPLSQFLGLRGFLREVVPLDEARHRATPDE